MELTVTGSFVSFPHDLLSHHFVLPTRLELEAYYPAKMSAFYDIKMIWYTVVCILCSVVGKEPKGIFNELVSAVPESKKPEEVNV